MSDKLNKLMASALAALAIGPSAIAGPESLCPSGWTCEKDRRGKGYTFTAPGGADRGEADVDSTRGIHRKTSRDF